MRLIDYSVFQEDIFDQNKEQRPCYVFRQSTEESHRHGLSANFVTALAVELATA